MQENWKKAILLYCNVQGEEPEKFDMCSFSQRKLFQKTIYLLQKLGVDAGYSFGWYIYGPYSSELTRDGFYAIPRKEELSTERTLPTDDEAVTKLTSYFGADVTDPVQMELYASIVFLKKDAYLPDKSEDGIVRELVKKKPYFTEAKIRSAIEHLKERNFYS